MSVTETHVKSEATVAPRDCFHDSLGLVYRTAGKQKQYIHQCTFCGAEMAQEPNDTTVQERLAAKPFDWGLRSSGQRLDYHTGREAQDQDWRDRYDKHLASKEWQDLRKRIFFRCQGICEGCRKNPAVHVHHLTYKRMGHEMLFDLVGVCRDCHQGIHPDKELI